MFLVDRHHRDHIGGPQSSDDDDDKCQSYWPEGEKDYKNLPRPTHPPSTTYENHYLYTTRNTVTTRDSVPADQHLLRPSLPILVRDPQTETYGRSRKEFFLDDLPDVPSQEDMEGDESDFRTYFPRGQPYSSRSRSSSPFSSTSSSRSLSPKSFSLHPATFPNHSTRSPSPHQPEAGPSDVQAPAPLPSESDSPMSVSREGSPPCSFDNANYSNYNHSGISRSSFPHHYRNSRLYSPFPVNSPYSDDSSGFTHSNLSLLAHATHQLSPRCISEKAKGKQRESFLDTGYETGYESNVSGVPASELADLRLDGISDVMDDRPSPTGGTPPSGGGYAPSGMASSMSVFPANPRRPRPKATRPQTSASMRNSRTRERSATSTSAENDDDDEGSPLSRRGKRPPKRPAVETDDEWEPGEAPPSKASHCAGEMYAGKSNSKKRKTSRYPCPITGCKETFTRRNDVRRHVMNAAVHRDSEEAQRYIGETGTVTRCRLCNADLSRADARMRHERTSACGKRTTQKMKDQMIVMRV